MERKAELEQVRSICKEFVRNWLCYSKAVDIDAKDSGTLPIVICNNFFDIALLNWAHLFGGSGSNHFHYENVIGDNAAFKATLLQKLSISESEFDYDVSELKRFRDKRVAHMDKIPRVMVPSFDVALKSVSEYYEIATKELESLGVSPLFHKKIEVFVQENREYYDTQIEKILEISQS